MKIEVDMSDRAITARLNQVEQLRRLCLSLSKAKLITPEKVVYGNSQKNRDAAPTPAQSNDE